MNPAKPLVDWYKAEGRELPWRNLRDPYKIWISEIILQQTRVAQGLDYFNRFIERFPDVFSLAQAPLDEVLKYWEGLGYYSRARNLHYTAKVVADEMNGVFPDNHKALEQLKGIGPYTSRAIASLAFGEKTAVLDGNVFRVTSRLLADFSPIDVPATRKKFQAILDQWIQTADPSDFNQAMMDLGAMVCTPRNPSCMLCPVQEMCKAFREGDPEALPVKAKKMKRSERWHNFHLVTDGDDRLLIRQRPMKGLWAGLWEIPNEEVEKTAWKKGLKKEKHEFLGEMKHVFTHFDMHIKIYRSDHFPGKNPDSAQYVPKENLSIFAFSRAVLKILDGYLT